MNNLVISSVNFIVMYCLLIKYISDVYYVTFRFRLIKKNKKKVYY